MKILLADDHTLFRCGLLPVLRELDEAVEIIEVGTCEEMLTAIETHPDIALALVDIAMPDGDGLSALMKKNRTIPAVVLSGSERPEDIKRALRSGAMGFMPKSITPAVMLTGLRMVLAGGTYIPPQIVRQAKAVYARKAQGISNLGLTPRQLDVLALVIEGKSNKEIARELGLSEATVLTHMTAVLRTLNVSNRQEAVRKADELKIQFVRD